MDIYCRKCGEPVEIDYLHDVASAQDRTFEQVWSDFRRRGCEALDERHGEGTANEAIALLAELAGDDIDGFASDIEDFGL